MTIYVNINYPEGLRQAVRAIEDHGGQAYLVGGAVRDALMCNDVKDLDVEVFGLSEENLVDILVQVGFAVELVGKSFGVFTARSCGISYDFSLPRREEKTGPGHRDFQIVPDPTMTIAEAAIRRDFTINALAVRIMTGEVIDTVGGVEDISHGILRPTSTFFDQDPLRVLRGMQFAARFNMSGTVNFFGVAYRLMPEYHTISRERVWMEWQKWAAARYPTRGLAILVQTGWVNLYPQLTAMFNVEHRGNDYHRDGETVWNHTVEACARLADNLATRNISRDDWVVLMLAMLCHDMGKPATNVAGRFHGHDEVGAEQAEQFLVSIGCPPGIIASVVALVRNHMVHDINTLSAVRRLAHRLGTAATVGMMALIVESDIENGSAEVLMRLADELGVVNAAPAPLVMGRHLIAEGVSPGREMGRQLHELFEAQLDGAFETVEDGVRYWRMHQFGLLMCP